MCATAFCRRWLVPRWAGPSPPRTPSPSSPSTCCLDSLTWVPVSHRSCRGNLTKCCSPFFFFSKERKKPNCSLYHAAFSAVSGGVYFMDLFFSAHRCMSELPTPFQIYHLWCRELWHFHTTWGVELVLWYSSHTAFVCPRCLWRVKVERANAGQVQAPEESWCVRQGWAGVMSGLQGNRAVRLHILSACRTEEISFSTWIYLKWVMWLDYILS